MNRKWMPIFILGALSVLWLTPMAVQAQGNDFNAHYHRYLFYNLGMSARSAGMGGAYSALRGGELGLLGNPASLGFLENRLAILKGDLDEISGSTSLPSPNARGFDSSTSDSNIWSIGAGGAYPFEWGALGLNYNYRDDDRDIGSFDRGTFDMGMSSEVSRHDISLSAAYRYMDELSFGYRYSYIDWNMDTNITDLTNFGSLPGVEEEFSGHRNQFGVQYSVNETLMLGLDGYLGLGDWDVNGGSSGDADSWAVRAGAAWNPLIDLPLLIAFDVKYENREFTGGGTEDDLWGLHLGAEYEVIENLYLRAGYLFEDFDYTENSGFGASPSVSGFSGGLGYMYEAISLDYGFLYTDTGGDGDFMHVFGLVYEF
ncbi:MAG: hypothetical protein AB1656_19930 [Candidatus Omnitrophota bacterium]